MSVSYSMFFNGIATYSGAIFFDSYSSVLRMICANRCSASSHYHYAYIQASKENQIEFLSLSLCSHETSGYMSIFLSLGLQRLDNTNYSLNKAYMSSSIRISSQTLFTSSYCTFMNNIVSYGICFFFSPNIVTMSYANIIDNNSPSNFGVVYVNGGPIHNMEFCVFKNNQNTLFFLESGSLEVSHSFISHTNGIINQAPVSTSKNNTFIQKQTYVIQFYDSHYCKAEIPISIQKPINTLFDTLVSNHLRAYSMIYPLILI